MLRAWFIFLTGFLLFSCSRKAGQVVLPPVLDTEAEFDYWQHSPIHPSNNEKVSFIMKARDESLIAKVELYVYEYKLYKNKQGLPSKKRKPAGVWGLQKVWTFDRPQYELELLYEMDKPFGKATNVEYIFQVTNVQGVVSSRFATFDAGDSPWPNDKILLYSTSPSLMVNTINVAFIKDVDFGPGWKTFLKDVEHLVYDGYFKNNMIGPFREKWAFYYTSGTANGYEIAHGTLREEIFPDFLTKRRIEGIDVYGLLHRNKFKDGAYLMGNLTFLSNNLFTSESYNIGTAVHETAHAVFNLSDEYTGCVCYEPATGANMFKTEEGCDALNAKLGVPAGQCTRLKNYAGEDWYMAEQNVYFPDEEKCKQFAMKNGYGENDCSMFIDYDNSVSYRSEKGLCIMQDDGDATIRNFQKVCSYIIKEHYDQLEDGTAFWAPGEVRENIFGYQPVVMMEFSRKGEGVEAKVIDIHQGIPSKRWKNMRAMTLDICRKDKSVILSLNIHSPRMVYVHGSSDGDMIKWLDGGKTRIQVPYTADFSLLECHVHISEPGTETAMPGRALNFEINLEDQLQRVKRKFEEKVN